MSQAKLAGFGERVKGGGPSEIEAVSLFVELVALFINDVFLDFDPDCVFSFHSC